MDINELLKEALREMAEGNGITSKSIDGLNDVAGMHGEITIIDAQIAIYLSKIDRDAEIPRIMRNARVMEIAYKRYIYACLKHQKKDRIKIIKDIKESMKNLIPSLLSFRDSLKDNK